MLAWMHVGLGLVALGRVVPRACRVSEGTGDTEGGSGAPSEGCCYAHGEVDRTVDGLIAIPLWQQVGLRQWRFEGSWSWHRAWWRRRPPRARWWSGLCALNCSIC